jgi:hypothetical protein
VVAFKPPHLAERKVTTWAAPRTDLPGAREAKSMRATVPYHVWQWWSAVVGSSAAIAIIALGLVAGRASFTLWGLALMGVTVAICLALDLCAAIRVDSMRH